MTVRSCTEVEKLGRRTTRWIARSLAVFALSITLWAACTPTVPPATVTGPQDVTDLEVTAVTETPSVPEGSSATVTASATGGTPPYRYRWDQNAGPAMAALGSDTENPVAVGPFSTTGRYVFRVVATDAEDVRRTGFVAIEVDQSDLSVEASTDTSSIFEGSPATLRAEATGGVLPYRFLWSQVDGPETLTLGDAAVDELSLEPLLVPGSYEFDVSVTDDLSVERSDSVTIEVVSAITATAPRLIVVGEGAELSATVEDEDAEVVLVWEILSDDATIDEADTASATLTVAQPGTVRLELTATLVSDGSESATLTRAFDVVSVTSLEPRVLIETNLGGITLELAGESAPLHTANFLQYVDEAFYDGILFHRSACAPDPETGDCEPFVIQAGGFERVDGELRKREPTQDPVPSESDNGLTNSDLHSVAMALSGGDSDSGTTEFFINLADNGFLDERGFTVFARVIDGFDTVDAIVALETIENPVLDGELSLPVEDVVIERIIRVAP